MASSTNVSGDAVPLASEAEKVGELYLADELALLVEAGVKKALAELEAAKNDAGGTVFGVASLESSKVAEEFREGMQKFMEERTRPPRLWKHKLRALLVQQRSSRIWKTNFEAISRENEWCTKSRG